MSQPPHPDQRVPSPTAEFETIAALVFTFLVTRIVVAASMRLEAVSFVANDVGYYAHYLERMLGGETGLMVEYPVPAVWILMGLYRLGGGWETWTAVFVLFFLLLDAAVAASLYRRGRAAGTLFWILFTAAQGPIIWYRFDLIPAALVAWACLFLLSRPGVAGGLIGLGAAVKLWPALLIAPMLAPDPLRAGPGRRRLGGFVVVGLSLAAASLVTSGWERSASPVTWQSDRGLQIESVPATPLMFLRTFTDDESWPLALSPYNAVEVVAGSPGVSAMLLVSTALTAGTVLLALWLTWRLLRNVDRDDPRLVTGILLAVLCVVLALIVSNKTLSPQYMVWLGGPVAVLLVHVRSGALLCHVHVLAAALVSLGALTQVTYPWGTYGILAMPLGSGPETAVLVLRNVGLVILTGYATVLAVRVSARNAGRVAEDFG